MLVYSGIARSSSDFHNEQVSINSSADMEASLEKINLISEDFASKLKNHSADFDYFSSLLNDSWEAKSALFPDNKITYKLKSIYEKAMHSGALCGKLACGVEEVLLFLYQINQDNFKKRMNEYICIPMKITFKGIEKVL